MKLDMLIEQAKAKEAMTVAVAAAHDEDVLKAVCEAIHHKLASFALFGDEEKIHHILEGIDASIVSHEQLTIYHCETEQSAVEEAVKAVSAKEANILMKGHVETAMLLKSVLNKEYGLRKEKVLSHAALFEIPTFDRLLFVTDAAMNIQPDLEQKTAIINNTVRIANKIGMTNPKVAPLAAVEAVNTAMSATTDAAILTQMNRRGQIKDCVVDGPLALDNAISLVAAKHKHIESEVAGMADILVVPTIEVGNVLYKSLVYFAQAEVAAVIAGARAPIVLTSRADDAKTKLYSLALAVCTA
ncbi:phosphate butyryltransferase [Priestia taiwanensis]|uniref:Phosphate butyryltransferase n=1 Tax=Priestia taiwanensis TaxID=1347902 RepID=A0A917EJM6_9BACI|nr:phosphate butyryltransferase [Priestia taiwanensis]MBM7361418.1 phosphate butyryltransferase [Priestia taiwanensis]GGE53981.1 phosphate butyryltransferase [Priestia taiwanensis]